MPQQRVIVLDTETTGLLPYDRVVSLAAIRFDRGVYVDHIYRIYDPRKDCHPGAAAIHGWDDWTLRFQPLFAEEADEIGAYLGWADCLVMHNAGFDLHYVERELRKAQRPPLGKGAFCTLDAARATWPGASHKLADCARRLGLGRQAAIHDAFQDAYLTAQLYFHLNGAPISAWTAPWPRPSNLLPAMPMPERPFPRRTVKRPGWREVSAGPAAHRDDRQRASRVGSGARALVKTARDAQLLIRFVGVATQVPLEIQLEAVDAYSQTLVMAHGQELSADLRQALRDSALAMIGSQTGATTAAKRLAADPARLAAVLPLLMTMVRRDGVLSTAEDHAMRHVFAVIRKATADAARAGTPPGAPAGRSEDGAVAEAAGQQPDDQDDEQDSAQSKTVIPVAAAAIEHAAAAEDQDKDDKKQQQAH